MPAIPGLMARALTWLRRRCASARRWATSARWTASWASTASDAMDSRSCSMPFRLPSSRAATSESLRVRSAMRPWRASSVFVSACILACSKSAWTRAAAAFWSSCWLWSRTFSSVYCASAWRSCDSASRACSSSSGLLSSRITESAFTKVPGRMRIRSTRPSAAAGIQRTSSGTRVPRPRTSRSIGPRLTASIRTPERSTLGAAGLSRDRPSVTRSKASAPPA